MVTETITTGIPEKISTSGRDIIWKARCKGAETSSVYWQTEGTKVTGYKGASTRGTKSRDTEACSNPNGAKTSQTPNSSQGLVKDGREGQSVCGSRGSGRGSNGIGHQCRRNGPDAHTSTSSDLTDQGAEA